MATTYLSAELARLIESLDDELLYDVARKACFEAASRARDAADEIDSRLSGYAGFCDNSSPIVPTADRMEWGTNRSVCLIRDLVDMFSCRFSEPEE